MPHLHPLIDFVVTAYIVHQDRVLLVHHNQLHTWLPIGGHIELNEDPEQALFREIHEETGLTPDQFTLRTTKPTPSFTGFNFLYPPNFLDIHTISPTHRHISFTYFIDSATSRLTLNHQEHSAIDWFTEKQLTNLNLKPNVFFYATKLLSLNT